MRVWTRIAQVEACEPDPHLRDDLQIAKLTVLYAATGEAVRCSPQVLASYQVLGLHPEKVWPAIEARRKALGPMCAVSGAPPVPKKAAQSVKLWAEKTNGARAINSRADTTLLRDNTISVPMAAPSIAALYRNSEAPSSAKTRQFTLDELKQIVHYSGAPLPTRALTIAALEARGPWPNQDGPATPILCISLKGMMLEGGVCKRTVQRRIKRACGLGFWRRTREANSWMPCPKCGAHRDEAKCAKCNYRGSSKNRGEFTRPYTYEFDVEKFMSTPRCREIHSEQFRSYADYKESAKRGEHPNLREMPRKSPQPAPPDPPPATTVPTPAKQPAAEHAHRNTVRQEPKPQPKLTKRECAKFVADMAVLMKGYTHHTEAVGGYGFDLKPSDPRYRPKLTFQQALTEVAKGWKRERDAVIDALKFWGYQLQE
jgi:hypothetical protein